MTRATIVALACATTACVPFSRLATATYGIGCDVALPLVSTLRIDMPHGIVARRDRGAIVYAIPVMAGWVLIDAGIDESARMPKELTGAVPPRAILLTHGHVDHYGGAAELDVPTYLGRADVQVLHGERCMEGSFTHLAQHVLDEPVPRSLIPVDDGARVHVGGETFTAISLPGHTQGITGWLWRDVLFVGDALYSLDGETLRLPPMLVTDDVDQAGRSLRRLRDVKFDYLADGHYGLVREPQRKLATLLDAMKRSFTP